MQGTIKLNHFTIYWNTHRVQQWQRFATGRGHMDLPQDDHAQTGYTHPSAAYSYELYSNILDCCKPSERPACTPVYIYSARL